MTCERWLPIRGYEGIYDVSDHGRVRSLPRRDSRGWRRPGIVLKMCRHGEGYHQVTLWQNNIRDNRLVHTLVLEAFVGPCPEGHECLHGNDIRTDNVLSNLSWGTRSKNIQDCYDRGRR